MSYRFTQVKNYKRGATWPSGQPRMCVRCAYENRPRRRQAVTVALLQYVGSKIKVPVSYCDQHIPDELITKDEEEE